MSQDQEFEKYLEGKTDLSKLHAELPQVELPDHLDAAILAEAHRAVNSHPGAKPKRRWTMPLGLVASLIVAVMVGLQLPYMLKDAAQPQQLKAERMAALTDKNTTEPAPPAPLEAQKNQSTEEVKFGIARSEPAPREAAEGAARSMPAPANAPRLAAPAASTSTENTQLGVTSMSVAPPAAAPAPPSSSQRMGLRERGDTGNAELRAKEKQAAGQAEGLPGDALRQRAPAAAKTAAPQPVQAAGSLLQSTKEEAAGDESQRPQDWLLRIKKLQQEGKVEEAKKELAAFKKRYPDYPVPAAHEIR